MSEGGAIAGMGSGGVGDGGAFAGISSGVGEGWTFAGRGSGVISSGVRSGVCGREGWGEGGC